MNRKLTVNTVIPINDDSDQKTPETISDLLTPLSAPMDLLDYDDLEPKRNTSSKAQLKLGMNSPDLKKDNPFNLERLKQFVSLDFQREAVLKITPPGLENNFGPWSDSDNSSPIPVRSVRVGDILHIITFGIPYSRDSTQVRRIKIYQHYLATNLDAELIAADFKSDSLRSALGLATPYLRNPYNGLKIVDKIMNIDDAKRALSGAQKTLQPLFGSWLLSKSNFTSFNTHLYLLSHSKNDGTTARICGKVKKESSSETIRNLLVKTLDLPIQNLWNTNFNTGFSMLIAVPLGKDEFGKLYI